MSGGQILRPKCVDTCMHVNNVDNQNRGDDQLAFYVKIAYNYGVLFIVDWMCVCCVCV